MTTTDTIATIELTVNAYKEKLREGLRGEPQIEPTMVAAIVHACTDAFRAGIQAGMIIAKEETR